MNKKILLAIVNVILIVMIAGCGGKGSGRYGYRWSTGGGASGSSSLSAFKTMDVAGNVGLTGVDIPAVAGMMIKDVGKFTPTLGAYKTDSSGGMNYVPATWTLTVPDCGTLTTIKDVNVVVFTPKKFGKFPINVTVENTNLTAYIAVYKGIGLNVNEYWGMEKGYSIEKEQWTDDESEADIYIDTATGIIKTPYGSQILDSAFTTVLTAPTSGYTLSEINPRTFEMFSVKTKNGKYGKLLPSTTVYSPTSAGIVLYYQKANDDGSFDY